MRKTPKTKNKSLSKRVTFIAAFDKLLAEMINPAQQLTIVIFRWKYE